MIISSRQQALLKKLNQDSILKFFLQNMNYKFSSKSSEIKKFFIAPLLELGYKETSVIRSRIRIAICTYSNKNSYFIRITVHAPINRRMRKIQDTEVEFIAENWELNWKNNNEQTLPAYFYLS